MMELSLGLEIWAKINGDIKAAVVVKVAPLHVELVNAEVPEEAKPSKWFPRVQDTRVPDCCSLIHLDEANILRNLEARYETGDIYTLVSNVLLSVNPYEPITRLYTSEVRESYSKTTNLNRPPHPFALASLAYHRMLLDEKSQAILISGESGAGKTENAKFIMGFLGAQSRTENSICKNLQAKMVEYINPVLESFGNATTVRNDNSSRFGKFNSLVFDKGGSLLGSKVETFLLENNRVVHYGAKERTYHVFYEMFSHPEATKSFFLDPKNKYRVLGTLKREPPPRNDSKNFQTLATALVKTGFKKEESLEIFRILAALIHFGEIEFRENDEIAYIVDSKPLKRAAELLGFDEDRCRDVLLSKQIIVMRAKRESVYRVPFRMDKAKSTLSSLMKTIYKRLFDYVVKRMNNGAPAMSNFVVRILDIYGFEQLEANSLEQLCINLANEELHKYFIVNCMEFEQKAYEIEELKWTHVTLPNNGVVVDVIKNIFTKMDEHGRLLAKNQKTTDERLTQEIINNNRGKNDSTSTLTEPRRRNARSDIAMGFILKHYAGTVTYETASWLEKNNSRMSMEQEGILGTSARRIVKTFADVENNAPNISVCTKYSNDLTNLLNTVKHSNVQYIRCLKPNANQKPKQFDRRVVLAQMIQSGTVELVNVLHHGWPCRCEFKQLSDRFQPMLPPEYFALMDARTFTEALMMAFGVPKTDFCLGKTKLFMKSGKMSVLDQLKDQDIVLSTVMRYIRRKKITRCMHAIGFLLWYRKYIRRRRLDKLRAALQRSVVNYVRLRRWLDRTRRRIRQRNIDAGCHKLRLACYLARGMKRCLIKARRSLRRKETDRLLHVWFRACNFQIQLRRWARSVIRKRRRSRHNAIVFAIVLLSIQLQRARKRIRGRKCQQHLQILARNVFLGIRLRRVQRASFPRLQIAHTHRCAALRKTYFGRWRRQVTATRTLHRLERSHDQTTIANGFSSWRASQREERVASLWTTAWRFVLLCIYLRRWFARRRKNIERKIERETQESRRIKMEQRFQEQQRLLDQYRNENTPGGLARSSITSAACRSDIPHQHLKRPLDYTSPLTSRLTATPQKVGRMLMFASPSADTEVDVFVQEPTVEFPLQVNFEEQGGLGLCFPSLGYGMTAGTAAKTTRTTNIGETTTMPYEIADRGAEEDEDLQRAFRTTCMVVLFTNYVLCTMYLKRWVKRWRADRQREARFAKRPKINVDSTPNSTRPRSSTPVLQTQLRRKAGRKMTAGSQAITPESLSSIFVASPPVAATPLSRLRTPLAFKCTPSEFAHSASPPAAFPAPSMLTSLLAPTDFSVSASPAIPRSPLTPQSMLRAPMLRRPFQSPSSTRLVTSRDFPSFSAGARSTRNAYSYLTNTAAKHRVTSMSNMFLTPQEGKLRSQAAMPNAEVKSIKQTTRHVSLMERSHRSDGRRTENQLNSGDMSPSPVPRAIPFSAPPKRPPSQSPPAKRLRTSWAQLTSGLSWAAHKLFGFGGSPTADPLPTTVADASCASVPREEEERAGRAVRSLTPTRITLNERRQCSPVTVASRVSPLPLLSSPAIGRTNLHASPRPSTAKRRVSLLRFSSASERPSLLSFDSTGETPRSEAHCVPTTVAKSIGQSLSPLLQRQCSPLSELSEGRGAPKINANTTNAVYNNVSPRASHQPSIPLAIFSPMSGASDVKAENDDQRRRKKEFSRHLNAYMEHVNRNQSEFKSYIRKPGWTATK